MIEYRSTDSSHPAITGEANKLNLALKAILVDGYGSKSPAGWSRPYSSGNYSAFQQGGGHQRFLAIDDSDTRLARLVGYCAMTDATTGTDPFPTSAQVSGGLYMRKSVTADTTERPWACWADNKCFYLVIFGALTTAAGTSGGDSHMGFGDSVGSQFSNDAYNTFLIGGTDANATSTTATANRQTLTALSSSTNTGHYMPRPYTQVGTSTQFGKCSAGFYASLTTSGNATGTIYPDSDSKLNLTRMHITHSGSPIIERGMLPGIWSIQHVVSGNMTLYDTVSGATGSSLDGKTFVIIGTASAGFAIETTAGSWDG